MGAKFLSRIEKLGTDGQTAGQCFRKKSKIALTFYFPRYTDLTFLKGTGKNTCVACLRSNLACKHKKDNFIHFSYFLKEVFA